MNTKMSKVVSSISTVSLPSSNRCSTLLVMSSGRGYLSLKKPVHFFSSISHTFPSHRIRIHHIVNQLNVGNVEVKRAAGYFLATICEEVEFHGDLYKEGAFQAIVALVRYCTVSYLPYHAAFLYSALLYHTIFLLHPASPLGNLHF